MKQVASAVLAMTCFAFLALAPAEGQPMPKAVQVGFVNKSDADIRIFGQTMPNGGQRGRILPIKKKVGMAYEPTTPGPRFYTIYDHQTNKVLLQSFRVDVPSRGVVLKIVPSPDDPKKLTLVPAD